MSSPQPFDPNQWVPVKEFNLVAQVSHILGGLVSTAAIHGIFGSHVKWLFLAGGGAYILYATWHEFIYDPANETPAVRGSDWEDWAFQVGGVILGAALVYFIAKPL